MGAQVVDEDITTASGHINGEESISAFTMLTNLFNQGAVSPNVLGGGIGTADGHGSGKYAMIIEGPWMVPSATPLSVCSGPIKLPGKP